jgi:hypothetical protein
MLPLGFKRLITTRLSILFIRNIFVILMVPRIPEAAIKPAKLFVIILFTDD